MRSFKDVYKSSKESVREAQNAQIALQRQEILAAMSNVYGVKNFSTLNESEKAKYKGLLLEYWNPKTGMTKKGKLLIKESQKTIFPASSQDEIKEYFQNEIHKNIKECLGYLSESASGRESEIIKAIEKCESLTGGKKISDSLYEGWAKEQISKDINEMLKINRN